MAEPLVSIITVVRNRARFVEEAMRSVLGQTYPNLEYVVVDGASTDGTLEVVQKYRDRLGAFISEPDKGLFDAVNKGIRLARGEIVGLLHADDVFASPETVTHIVRAMQEKDADAAWGDLLYVDQNDPQKAVRFWQSSPFRPGIYRRGWMPPHVTFFAKKELFEKYGYYDMAFGLSADFELMTKFLEVHKVRGVYVPEIITRMRTGGVSNHSLKNIKQLWRFRVGDYRALKHLGLPGAFMASALKPFLKFSQSFAKPPEAGYNAKK